MWYCNDCFIGNWTNMHMICMLLHNWNNSTTVLSSGCSTINIEVFCNRKEVWLQTSYWWGFKSSQRSCGYWFRSAIDHHCPYVYAEWTREEPVVPIVQMQYTWGPCCKPQTGTRLPTRDILFDMWCHREQCVNLRSTRQGEGVQCSIHSDMISSSCNDGYGSLILVCRQRCSKPTMWWGSPRALSWWHLLRRWTFDACSSRIVRSRRAPRWHVQRKLMRPLMHQVHSENTQYMALHWHLLNCTYIDVHRIQHLNVPTSCIHTK